MTRRDFIFASAAAAAFAGVDARAASPAVPLSPADAIPAIDTHIHLYDPSRPQGVPWPPKNDAVLHRTILPADFRRTVAPHRVVGTVVVEASEWVEDNQWVLDLARDHHEIVGVVGQLKPGQSEFAANLRRFAANPLFRGLRIRAADVRNAAEPAVAADLARLVDAGLSLDVLGGAAIVAPTEQLAARLPALRIVVDHLPFKEWDAKPAAMADALKGIAACPNVFIKISDVVRRVKDEVILDPAFYQPGLDVLLQLFGPDRILFGSNWPVSDRQAPYATVHRVVADYFAAQGRAVAEKYFWRNSRTAYRWQPRGAAAALGQ